MANRLTFSKSYGLRLDLDDQEKARIAQMYTDISNNVGSQIQMLQGIDTRTAYYQQIFLNDLQQQLNSELVQLGRNLEGQITMDAHYVAGNVLQENVQWAQQFNLPIGARTATVRTDIVASVLNGKLYGPLPDGSNWTLSKAIWNTTEHTQKTIESIIAEGIARNASALDIARQLEYFIDPSKRKDYDISEVYPGATGVIDYNAFRLARTAVSHAYQQAILRATEKNPFVEGLQWHTAGDHRVCEICNEYEEQDAYDLGVGVFPKDEVPMDHPMGRCTLIPVMPSMDDIADAIANWINGEEDAYTSGLDEYSNYF